MLFNFFFQKVVRPAIRKEAPDQALIDEVLTDTLPRAMDYLEGQIGETGFLCGDFSLADITVAGIFRNAFYAGWQVDESLWPRMKAYLVRAHAVPSMARVGALADEMLKAPPRDHEALLEKHYGKAA